MATHSSQHIGYRERHAFSLPEAQRSRGVSVIVGPSGDPQVVRVRLSSQPRLALCICGRGRLLGRYRSFRGSALRRGQLRSGFRQLPLQCARELPLALQ